MATTYDQIKSAISQFELADQACRDAYWEAAAAGHFSPTETLSAADLAESEAVRLVEANWRKLSPAQRGALRRMFSEFITLHAPQ